MAWVQTFGHSADMHEAPVQFRGPNGISLQHEAVVEDVTNGVAAGLSHTYEGQREVLNGGKGALLGLGQPSEQGSREPTWPLRCT